MAAHAQQSLSPKTTTFAIRLVASSADNHEVLEVFYAYDPD
jgi:hypothetical protein